MAERPLPIDSGVLLETFSRLIVAADSREQADELVLVIHHAGLEEAARICEPQPGEVKNHDHAMQNRTRRALAEKIRERIGRPQRDPPSGICADCPPGEAPCEKSNGKWVRCPEHKGQEGTWPKAYEHCSGCDRIAFSGKLIGGLCFVCREGQGKT